MNQGKGVPRRNFHVVVIGAGAFGGWTALHLLRQGAKVTLLDAWGPGNSRASSGGDTRVIRGAYSGDADYIEWVARSFLLWRGGGGALANTDIPSHRLSVDIHG